jgi:hypothetical protein
LALPTVHSGGPNGGWLDDTDHAVEGLDGDRGLTALIKKQQMRWNRWTMQPFLDVRTAVLNGTLEAAIRRRYPDFRSANRNVEVPTAA